MLPDHKVFDRSVEFHEFLLGMKFVLLAQLVCVSVMRNSWDGFSFEGGRILGAARVKALVEMFKSALAFLPELPEL